MAGAVELVARFAGTLICATRVRPNEQFVIGTAPGVDLPVLGTTKFPLVDRGSAIRIPIGVDPIHRGDTTVLAIGLVTIELTRTRTPPIAMPRPPGNWRLAPYAFAALALHVAIVAFAMWSVDVHEPITIPVVRAEPPRRVPTTKLPEPKPKPKPEKKREKQTDVAVQAEPQTEQTTIESAQHAGVLGSASLDDLSMVTGSKDLAKELSDVGPLYDEQAANAQSFGNSAGAFDPTKDPAFDSVKVGPVVISGAKMGQGYKLKGRGMFREVARPPIMGLTCDDGTCTTVGTLDRFTVRDYVEKRYVDMLKCFERHSKGAPRIEVTLEFDIREDGTSSAVKSESEQRGFATCLSRIVERTKFPTDKPTQVRYPIAFWRT
jgi:hypothetical protein